MTTDLARHGLRALQIREKDLPEPAYRELVACIKDALAGRHAAVQLFLNSKISLANELGVHVHLPEGSDVAAARQMLGPSVVIGVSCHSLESAVLAEQAGASFVLFGPVFPPISKSIKKQATGLAPLTEISKKIRVPVVAIGGVTPENAKQCLGAGASAVASVGALMAAKDSEKILSDFKKTLGTL